MQAGATAYLCVWNPGRLFCRCLGYMAAARCSGTGDLEEALNAQAIGDCQIASQGRVVPDSSTMALQQRYS